MSQMPDSVYLPNDSKYCTVGIFTAYNENYLLAENEFNEDCLDDYTEYTPMYRLEEERQHLIEKAVAYLTENRERHRFLWSDIEDFKKAMEEQ